MRTLANWSVIARVPGFSLSSYNWKVIWRQYLLYGVIKKVPANIRYSQPVWSPKKTRYWCNDWEVYSPKLLRDVKLFSDIEYYNWIDVEANPKIVTFCEQPLKVHAVVDDKRCSSIIDMWTLWFNNYEEFLEVKCKNKNSKMTELADKQIKIQQIWCFEYGFNHRVVYEEELCKSIHKLDNWRIILTNLSMNRDCHNKTLERAIIEFATIHNIFTLFQVIASFPHASRDEVVTAIYRMLHRGCLSSDLCSKPLTYNLELVCCHDEIIT